MLSTTLRRGKAHHEWSWAVLYAGRNASSSAPGRRRGISHQPGAVGGHPTAQAGHPLDPLNADEITWAPRFHSPR